jgi:hypothetical protein
LGSEITSVAFPPGAVTDAVQALALNIQRCPIVDLCRSGADHPCHKVVSWQQTAGQDDHLLPEAWSGHLAQANILFVFSNPSSTAQPVPIAAGALTSKSTELDLVLGAECAFDPSQHPGIKDGVYQVDALGRVSTEAQRTWLWTKQAAETLLGRPPRPGRDYAITDAVHCGSVSETGVAEALDTCTSRYLRPLLEAAGAAVIVAVGQHARRSLCRLFEVADLPAQGPKKVIGMDRYLLCLLHPSYGRYGHDVTIQGQLTTDELARVRSFLS